MDEKIHKGLVISDFNISNFVGYLNNDEESPTVCAEEAPYGQVWQTLMKESIVECIDGSDNCFAIIWTLPQGLIPSFPRVLEYQSVEIEKLYEEVDDFCEVLKNAVTGIEFAFLMSWTLPSYHRGFGLLDMKNGTGMSNILSRLNLRVADNLNGSQNIYLLNTSRWVELSGSSAYNPKFWYMGKIAFSNDVFKRAVADIKAGIRGIQGQSRKLILLDLDNTLWGGIVGDDGWKNLQLGGHDPVGESS